MGGVVDLRMKKVVVFLFMLMGVAALQLQSTDAQTTHVVLDSMGWTIPQSGAAAYTTWASSKTFAVGDVLLFNFPNGAHNVAEVSKVAFDSCTTTRTLSIINQGPANITLNSAGNHYFICAYPGHCSAGQKLAVTVSSATATPPTASPPTSTNTPSSPSPVDGTSPPPPNSAATFAGLPSWFTYVAFFMALLINRNLC